MRYAVDHDFHIHTHYSPCSNDMRQIPESVLTYGLVSGFKLLCLTDHSWDSDVKVNTATWGPLSAPMSDLPLPQSKNCHLLFGMEADMNYQDVLGVTKEHLEKLDFAVIATNHLNLTNFACDPNVTGRSAEERKKRYVERLHVLFDMDLPFYKTSLAHFSDGIVCDAEPIRCMTLFTDAEFRDIFTKVKNLGIGVELNLRVHNYTESDLKEVLRPLFIAKNVGCKFTLGGDAHWPEEFVGEKNNMERIVDILGLEETDKLPYIREMIEKFDKYGDEVEFLGKKSGF